MGNPRTRGLPLELQARLEVALTLSAQTRAIRQLTDAIRELLRHEAPEFTAYGVALDNHVRHLEAYFKQAELDAFGVRILSMPHHQPREK